VKPTLCGFFVAWTLTAAMKGFARPVSTAPKTGSGPDSFAQTPAAADGTALLFFPFLPF
jgi:hypothetical protein